KLAATRPEQRDVEPALALPSWLDASLSRSLGEERARGFRAGFPMPPPIDLRVERAKTSREAVRDAILLARPDAEVSFGRLSGAALRLRHAGDPRTLPGFDEGHFVVQEEGSQLIA